MAVYRAIGSYYTDILDMVNIAYVKNNNNYEAAWSSLDKLSLIKKLASTMLKLDRLQNTDISYWHSQHTTFVFYIIIFAIVLGLIFAIFFFFAYMRYKEYITNKSDKDAFSVLTKSVTMYVIMFMIIFTVFYLLMFNFGFVLKQCKAQLEKNSDDFSMFKNLLTGIPNGDLLDKTLLYIGYIQKDSIGEATVLLTKLKKEIDLVNNAQKQDSSSTVIVVDVQSLNAYYNLMLTINSSTMNQAVLSGQLLSDVHDSLKMFFNNGAGYYNLKLNVVSSSNVYTLREIRRVMNFYYFLTLKKSSDQSVQANIDNDHILIQELIISPIIATGLKTILSDQSQELKLITTITTSLSPYQLDLSRYTDYFVQQVEIALVATLNSKSYVPPVFSKKTSAKTNQENITKGEALLENLLDDVSVQQKPAPETCPGESPNLSTLVSSEETNLIKNLYQRITTEVFIHQQTSLKSIMGIGNIDTKFYTPYQYLLNMNQIPYQDFKEGLEIQYLSDLIQPFYNRISSAKDHYSLDDINYSGNRSVSTYQQFMSLAIAIIAMCWAYFWRVWKDGLDELNDRQGKELTDAKNKNDPKALKSTKKEQFRESVNTWIYFCVVTAGTFFIVCLIYSSYVKKRDVFMYNKEIIEANTSDFKESINEVLVKIEAFDNAVASKPLEYIGNISCITDQQKFDLQTLLLNMINKFENCNYVLESANQKFPFPYTEITVDLFMFFAIFGGIVYLTTAFKPGEKFSQIMSWKQQVSDLEIGIISQNPDQIKKIHEYIKCHDFDMDNIVFTLKVILFVFVFLFLLFYSTKILSSSNAFKQGIYNSAYYDNSQCYDK